MQLKQQELKTLIEVYGKKLWMLRSMPSHAAHWLAGVFLPPHERLFIGVVFGPYRDNHIVASRGTSKCHAFGTQIMMADGSLRKIENISPGESVMGPDSQPRLVLDTSTGYGPLYKVTQSAGMEYVVNEDHILSLKMAGADEILNMPVTRFMQSTDEVKNTLRGYKAGTIRFSSSRVADDPYVLGRMVGDEYKTSSGAFEEKYVVTNTSAEEPRKKISTIGGLPKGPIPEEYIVNSESVRLRILAGIVDSTGKRASFAQYTIIQKDEALADQIKYLADTLGFYTRKSRRIYKELDLWTVIVGGDVWRIPCLVKTRKVTKQPENSSKEFLLSEIAVTPAGEGQWAGITLGDDHLYLLSDGTVTHNTWATSSFAAPLKALLFADTTGLIVSASGFRGGKLIFEDTERLFHGDLRSQRLAGPFLEVSANTSTKNKVISRQPDMWTLKLKSKSTLLTVPTNTADTMRGIRATELFVDERNTFDDDVVQKVLRPMLNVGKDFRRTATGSKNNKIYQMSTIDFSFRGWFKELQSAKMLAEREYLASMALKSGDYKEYDRLMNDDDGLLRNTSSSITRIDYTDLIIPEKILDSEDGKVYKVNYPLTNDLQYNEISVSNKRTGLKEIFTYPVERDNLESPLHDGTADEAIWGAEQRNVFIETSGNVYPYELIKKVAERPLYKQGSIKGYEMDDEFFAPLMYSCGDPCVIGVDYARESDEFSIVVIRLGELAEGSFDPHMLSEDSFGRKYLGKTPWNNVIWAESWKKWTAEEAAAQIFEMYKRYNIVSKANVGRGIAMDKGGGGTAVRDKLARPSAPKGEDPMTWAPEVIIYDPNDEDYAHFAVENSPTYRGCLELLKPTNQANIEWTMGSKSLMQQGKLYLAFWMPPSAWAGDHGLLNASGRPDETNPEFQKILVGYNGIRKLKEQLLRIQSKVTESGAMRFIVPGDRTKEEGKKDLYSGFTYACKVARDHLVGLTKKEPLAPTATPIIVQIGRAGGDTRSYRSLGYGG